METFTRADGVRIRFTDQGDGLGVFLAHGQNWSHAAYDPQVPALVAAGYRAIAVDRIGRGASDTGTTRFSGTREARDYWDLLTSVGVERAVLVGHSSGSGLIQVMYRIQPDRVLGLVSIDSTSFGKLTDRPADTLVPDAPVDSGLDPRFDAETLVAYHRNKATLRKLGRLWDHPSDLNTKMLVEAEAHKRENAARWAALVPDPDAGSLPEPPPGRWCRVPLLIVTAGRGRIAPDDPEVDAVRDGSVSDDTTVLVVKNSGHWVHWEATERFNATLLEFLSHVRSVHGF